MDRESEQFKALVSDFVPINGLPPQSQNEIILQSEVATYKKRQLVFKQGDRDNYSYYLLEGELQLLADEQLVKQISGGTDAARYAMAQLQPRQMSGKAKTAITVLKVDRNLLDRLLTMDDKGDGGEVEVTEIHSEESVDWMTRLLQSELFARIPPANIQRIFTTLESVEVSAGDLIVEQGTPGDYYYLIQKGTCEVTRKTASGGEPIKLAELSDGDSFGEEALVSDAVRNASITMTSDGELMRLTKEDFVDLIKKPILSAVSYVKAESLVATGAIWLDVRFPEEHKDSGIKGSANIPFNTLRAKLATLDASAGYVVYCDTGGRSSGAAFLLAQNGIEVSYLSGGLMKSPMAPAAKAAPASAPSEQKPAKGKPAEPAEERPAKKPQRKAAPQPEAKATPPSGPGAGVEDDALEADIRASALGAELAKANFQIEEALKQKSNAELAQKRSEKEAKRAVEQERKRLEAQAAKLKQDAEEAKRKLAEAAKGQIRQERQKLEVEARRLKDEAEAAKEAAEVLAAKRIQQEREKLEAKASQANQMLAEAQRLKQELEVAKKQADQDAERRRAEEEAKLEVLKREAQERLRRESEKLEEEYARNAEELGRLRKEREEAEEKLRRERSKMDEQALEARNKLQEARKLKQETEASRRAVEMEVEEKREAQEEMERKMREEVNKKIQEERRKLEAEFARQAEEMERMQAEREAAEAARTAAQEEAQRIIAEYKEEHEKTLAEKEERERNLAEKEEQIRRERERLEEEQERVKATLEEARRAKEAADNTRQVAERRVNELRAAEAEAEKAAKSDEEAQLRSEIAAIEAEMDQAKQQLEEAEQAQQVAEVAQKAHEVTISRQQDVEDELARELAEEAVAWKEDFDAQEQDVEKAHNMVLDKEHIERIKRRAAEAKRQAEEANADLFGDVANQLD